MQSVQNVVAQSVKFSPFSAMAAEKAVALIRTILSPSPINCCSKNKNKTTSFEKMAKLGVLAL